MNTMDQIKLICDAIDQGISNNLNTRIYFYAAILATILFWVSGALLAKSRFKTKYSLFTILFCFCWGYASGMIILQVSFDYFGEFTMGALVICLILALSVFFIQAIVIIFVKNNFNTEKNKPIDQV
ncbi:MAG: hypothetical protein KBF62_02180 [Candidatus Pacebacteria bacterium]|nr:hypothetical protein [Candidatus Paceibacterota bacterium]MBP9058427.1 hypothetical protein [Candidatus Paceibacterota bacterium]MBP9770167.1 hypothetical protein [Candidatus Paceibacterota bacterium]